MQQNNRYKLNLSPVPATRSEPAEIRRHGGRDKRRYLNTTQHDLSPVHVRLPVGAVPICFK
jgi:hypothetical protein